MSEDCIAVGFSGEGRCIEPATDGQLCEHHAHIDRGHRELARDLPADQLARMWGKP